MNLQTFLDGAVKSARQARLKNSDQITLGELIEKIEPIVKNQKRIVEKYSSEAYVCFDFPSVVPTGIGSWRGSYDELSLDFDMQKDAETMPVTKFFNLLKGAMGNSFTGYKGGEYTMDKNTPIWVDNYGHANNTAVIDVVDNEYSVILITGLREF